MKVELKTIPDNSLIFKTCENSDFTECFSVYFKTDKPLVLDNLVYQCFNVFTKGWVDFLFQLRNKLVKPFKLNTSPDIESNIAQPKIIEKGGKVSFFDVADRNENEVLMYAKDIHLEAYFCITLYEDDNVKLFSTLTTVRFFNALGKYYFAVVRPFHVLIIKTMIKKVIKSYLS